METIQQALCSIIRSVLTALYEPFWAALLLAVVGMFVFLYAKEHHWEINNFLPQMVHVWCQGFRSSLTFVEHFYWCLIQPVILFR